MGILLELDFYATPPLSFLLLEFKVAVINATSSIVACHGTISSSASHILSTVCLHKYDILHSLMSQ